MKGKENPEKQIRIYEVDLSAAWDTVSYAEIFLELIKKLPFYRQGLLFSGFDADDIGKTSGSRESKGVVWCSRESDITGGERGEKESAVQHAMHYARGVVAVYDETKMIPAGDEYAYQPKEGACIALVRLKV